MAADLTQEKRQLHELVDRLAPGQVLAELGITQEEIENYKEPG